MKYNEYCDSPTYGKLQVCAKGLYNSKVDEGTSNLDQIDGLLKCVLTAMDKSGMKIEEFDIQIGFVNTRDHADKLKTDTYDGVELCPYTSEFHRLTDFEYMREDAIKRTIMYLEESLYEMLEPGRMAGWIDEFVELYKLTDGYNQLLLPTDDEIEDEDWLTIFNRIADADYLPYRLRKVVGKYQLVEDNPTNRFQFEILD